MNHVSVISTRGMRMNIQLDKQTEAFIERKVKDGTFKDASEAIREAVILWAERDDRRQFLEDELAIGIDDVKAGNVVEWTPALVDGIFEKAMQRFDAGERSERDGTR